MLLNLRYEWRLKSIEKYALDSLMGAGWERVSTVGFPHIQVVGFSVAKGRTRSFRFGEPLIARRAIKGWDGHPGPHIGHNIGQSEFTLAVLPFGTVALSGVKIGQIQGE